MNYLSDLEKLLQSQQLDIRVTHNARFMDQKCAPDVVTLMADCVLALPENEVFTKNTIWKSPYFAELLSQYFGKPSALEITAGNEYDKFTSQPLKTFAYAGILSEVKVGIENHYKVTNRQALEFCSDSATNSFKFLCVYLENVLRQSGFWSNYEEFRDSSHTATNLQKLKDAFANLLRENTPVRGVFEPNRIFPKVLNPLAVRDKIPGVRKGSVSKGDYLYSDLLYNAVNFRDTNKTKSVTRAQAGAQPKSPDYTMTKEMKTIRSRHGFKSELQDIFSVGDATQVHHIFPKSSHPEFKELRENLILLTATQHNSKAHPKNNTKIIDPVYQIECLLAKLMSIKESISKDDGFYDIGSFIGMVERGLNHQLPTRVSLEELEIELEKIKESI